MEEGVSESRNFLMFFSHDYMGRPFCLKELRRWAKLYGCTIVGVVEKDGRHGAVDFGCEFTLHAPVSRIWRILAEAARRKAAAEVQELAAAAAAGAHRGGGGGGSSPPP
jgi:hypothetical protein